MHGLKKYELKPHQHFGFIEKNNINKSKNKTHYFKEIMEDLNALKKESMENRITIILKQFPYLKKNNKKLQKTSINKNKIETFEKFTKNISKINLVHSNIFKTASNKRVYHTQSEFKYTLTSQLQQIQPKK